MVIKLINDFYKLSIYLIIKKFNKKQLIFKIIYKIATFTKLITKIILF